MRFKIPIIITPAKKTVPTGNKSVKRRTKFRNEKKGQLLCSALPLAAACSAAAHPTEHPPVSAPGLV